MEQEQGEGYLTAEKMMGVSKNIKAMAIDARTNRAMKSTINQLDRQLETNFVESDEETENQDLPKHKITADDEREMNEAFKNKLDDVIEHAEKKYSKKGFDKFYQKEEELGTKLEPFSSKHEREMG